MEAWRPMEDSDGMEYEAWLHEKLKSMNVHPPEILTRGLCKMDLGLAITNTVNSAATNTHTHTHTLSSATPESVCTTLQKIL